MDDAAEAIAALDWSGRQRNHVGGSQGRSISVASHNGRSYTQVTATNVIDATLPAID